MQEAGNATIAMGFFCDFSRVTSRVFHNWGRGSFSNE